jgi:hypothetical protein
MAALVYTDRAEESKMEIRVQPAITPCAFLLPVRKIPVVHQPFWDQVNLPTSLVAHLPTLTLQEQRL